MSALTVEEKTDPGVNHALKMRSAWSLSNYHSFFQLYSTAPNMGGYLLDLFVQRERERAMKTLIKSWVLLFIVLHIFLLCPAVAPYRTHWKQHEMKHFSWLSVVFQCLRHDVTAMFETDLTFL